MKRGDAQQLNLSIDQPQRPSLEATKKEDRRISPWFDLQSFCMHHIIGDPFRDHQRAIETKLAELEKDITDRELAFAYLQNLSKEKFDLYPIFYRALWELIKKKQWNKRPPEKTRTL